jgi:F-type H+-transporting ATPase subunit gamma
MAQMHNLRRRLASINSTGKISQGMKLISTTKLKTAQDRVFAARPFARLIAQLMGDLALQCQKVHPFFQQQEGRRALFLFTADRGLCGNFNHQLVALAQDYLGRAEAEVDLVAVGTEGARALARAGLPIHTTLLDYTSHPSFNRARQLASLVEGAYLGGQWQRVDLVYAKFYTVLHQKPRIFQLLPIPDSVGEPEQLVGDWLFEPDPETVLAHLAQRYLESELYRALLETQVGEHGARVQAMDTASGNARELAAKLTREYNRQRQGAITTELAEITAGAARGDQEFGGKDGGER